MKHRRKLMRRARRRFTWGNTTWSGGAYTDDPASCAPCCGSLVSCCPSATIMKSVIFACNIGNNSGTPCVKLTLSSTDCPCLNGSVVMGYESGCNRWDIAQPACNSIKGNCNGVLHGYGPLISADGGQGGLCIGNIDCVEVIVKWLSENACQNLAGTDDAFLQFGGDIPHFGTNSTLYPWTTKSCDPFFFEGDSFVQPTTTGGNVNGCPVGSKVHAVMLAYPYDS